MLRNPWGKSKERQSRLAVVVKTHGISCLGGRVPPTIDCVDCWKKGRTNWLRLSKLVWDPVLVGLGEFTTHFRLWGLVEVHRGTIWISHGQSDAILRVWRARYRPEEAELSKGRARKGQKLDPPARCPLTNFSGGGFPY